MIKRNVCLGLIVIVLMNSFATSEVCAMKNDSNINIDSSYDETDEIKLDDIEKMIVCYSEYQYDTTTDSWGNTVIKVYNSNELVNTLVLDNSNHSVLLDNQLIGTYSVQKTSAVKKKQLKKASGNWRYLGEETMTITEGQSTAAIVACIVMASSCRVPVSTAYEIAAAIAGAAEGGTLKIKTWERQIGAQTVMRHQITFITRSGKKIGPIEYQTSY